MHATSKIKFNGIVPFYLKCRRLLFINFESNKIGNLTMKILLLSQNEKKNYIYTQIHKKKCHMHFQYCHELNHTQ